MQIVGEKGIIGADRCLLAKNGERIGRDSEKMRNFVP